MKILIISTKALGDVLRTTFLAQALKDKHGPDKLKIYWLTDKKAKPLFINNPYVDEVLDKESAESLKKIKFDTIINLEIDTEVCKFVSSLKSKKIIGAFINKNEIDYTLESANWFDMSLISKLGLKKADQLKKLNKKTHRQILSEMIKVNPEKYEPFLRLTKKQRDYAQDFSRKHNLSLGELIIGINTGSADTWPKSLSVKKTAKLIDMISSRYNSKILLFGGPNETERNRDIQRYSKSPIIDTGSGNNLVEFPALVSLCTLFITTDSLGLHIALSLKRKTICLVGPTSPSELDMYGLGNKVIADSPEVCTYRLATKKCMEKIDLKKVINSINALLKQKVTLLITAFKEPNIKKSVESALSQKTNFPFDIILSAPDKETLDKVRGYEKNFKNFKIFIDPGKGKSYAINLLLKKISTDVLILTDGDVFLSDNSVEEISNLFYDPEVGCVTGRPVPLENKKTKYGFWANFLFDSAHVWRKKAQNNNTFIECSGYLFAFRKSKLANIPLDVAEDTVIPYYFWEKGYKIGYAENAKVYVKNATNWEDWMKQKIRTAKAHETLHKYVDIKTTPRVKTFLNEAKEIKRILEYTSGIKEGIWMIQLIIARLLMWGNVILDTKLKGKDYQDAWERIESTKES